MSVLSVPPPADDRLLQEARAGNAAAFWQLVEPYKPYLRGVGERLLRDRLPGDGSDVVATGLAGACQHLAQFRGNDRRTFLAWLVAIVRHEALQRLRASGRLRSLPEGGDEPSAGDSSGPEVLALQREQAARLRAALERLPEPDRQVIRLRNWEDLPFAEIARQLGDSEDTVRQRWCRALQKLRQQLGEASGGRQPPVE